VLRAVTPGSSPELSASLLLQAELLASRAHQASKASQLQQAGQRKGRTAQGKVATTRAERAMLAAWGAGQQLRWLAPAEQLPDGGGGALQLLMAGLRYVGATGTAGGSVVLQALERAGMPQQVRGLFGLRRCLRHAAAAGKLP
jgi:hypothetical protein